MHNADSIEFHSGYRGYEIFEKREGAQVSYIAYDRHDIKPAARSGTPAQIMGVLDALRDEEQRHKEEYK